MIDTPGRAQADGVPREQCRLGPDDAVVALVHEVRSPLAAIWNAVHLLSLARDEATVEKVRQMITRQLEHLSQILDDCDARRAKGGPEQVLAVGDGRPRADTKDA
jgi:nitrogen-specific signal transduction histidine kinase